MRVAVFPGSFDPFTKGHEDVVRRGLALFDKVIIGVGVNSNKTRLIELDEMVKYIEETFKNDPKVEVLPYEGLTAEFVYNCGAKFILRGLRNTTDFEFENGIAQGNKHLREELETVFLITSPQFAYISSTIARDIYRHGGDVSAFLPYKLKSKHQK